MVTLAVDPRATKHEIRRAVEQLFEVTVLDVRTMRMPRKSKRVGRFVGRKPRVEEGHRAAGRGPDDRVLRGSLSVPVSRSTSRPRPAAAR